MGRVHSWLVCSFNDPPMGAGDVEISETCSVLAGARETLKILPDNHLARVLMEGCTSAIASLSGGGNP